MIRIKQLRNSKGLKQIDLCKQLGVAQGALSGWENGKYEPDITSLKKMSEIFEVSIDYILGKDDHLLGNDMEPSKLEDYSDFSLTGAAGLEPAAFGFGDQVKCRILGIPKKIDNVSAMVK